MQASVAIGLFLEIDGAHAPLRYVVMWLCCRVVYTELLRRMHAYVFV